MTLQADVINDKNYLPVLNHGFVGIKDVLGNDAAIVQAARVSYGSGTKSVNEDRGLIRYLLKHDHGTPFEMTAIKFHVRCPILVMRQWHRHRLSSVNEESARYSIMTDEFYIPAREDIQPQSSDNKQGRAGETSDKDKNGVEWVFKAASEHSYSAYRTLLGEEVDNFYDLYEGEDAILSSDFSGVAKELARAVMPVSTYSEMYWQVNLRSLFHFLKLRADPHAQKEIRAFAEAMIELTRPYFPVAFEAWEDYVKNGLTLSRMEVETLRYLLSGAENKEQFIADYEKSKTDKDFAKRFSAEYGMNTREMTDFGRKFLDDE